MPIMLETIIQAKWSNGITESIHPFERK